METDGVGFAFAEHHVELGEPEDEGVGLVDQGDVDVVAERLGEAAAELQTAEAGSQDQDAHARRIATAFGDRSGLQELPQVGQGGLPENLVIGALLHGAAEECGGRRRSSSGSRRSSPRGLLVCVDLLSDVPLE